MRQLVRFAAVVAFVASGVSDLRAADGTDPAELFPPGTLAYAELHDPAALAPQLAAVFQGTPLEDSIAFLHARRDAAKNPRGLMLKEPLAALGLLASPEMLAEFRRLRGAAVGWTGFTNRGEPEGAIAVLTGESQVAGLTARAFLTLAEVRKVASVAGVPVYQFRPPTINYDPNGQPTILPEKITAGPHEFTCAYVPGLIVVGTSPAAVGDVLTRFREKAKDSLATVSGFREAVAAHRKAGVFFYADAPAICAKADELRKAGGGAEESDVLGWFRLVAHPKAVRYVAGCARFRDGGFSLTVGGRLDPTHESPLGNLLAGPGVKADWLRSAAPGAPLTVTISLPEKNRAAAAIGFLDALAKANGTLGRLPSDAVKELEAKYKEPFAAGLIGKTRAVTITVPAKQELPKGAMPLPLLVLHLESPEAAAAWEAFLPKLIGDLAGGNPAQPSSENVGGVTVFSLPGTGLRWKTAVHYARAGTAFAVGLDRKLTAAAIGARAASVPLLAGEPPALLGTFTLGGWVRFLNEPRTADGPVVPLKRPGSLPDSDIPGLPLEPDVPFDSGEPTPEEQKKVAARVWGELLKSLDGLPPVVVTVRREGNELRFEAWQPKVQGGGLAPVIAAALHWFEVSWNRNLGLNGIPGMRSVRPTAPWWTLTGRSSATSVITVAP